MPALSGNTASTLDAGELESRIRDAILHYEPRIVSSSLKVDALVSEMALDHHNQIQVEIRGKLWAQPVPLEILLRTQLDLEAGQVEVRDVLAGTPTRMF